MSSRGATLRARNEQIITFTLVELLTQLVFAAMLLAFVLRDETLRDINPSSEQLRAMKAELALKDKEIYGLKTKNAALTEQLRVEEDLVRSLLGTKGTTLPFGVKAISQEDFDYFASLKASLLAQQRATAAAQAALAAARGGGADRPNCLVTSRFLLNIDLLGDGSLEATPAWDKGARVADVDGLPGLVAGGPLSSADFAKRAARVHDWALNQEVPCVFKVTVRRRHANADMYDQQLRLVERSFYDARR